MDNFKNFAKVQVSTGYDASATSIALSSGHGLRLPTVPFNATWWNSTDYPDPSDDSNVEIVRVTAIVSDTLTVTRAQESTSASTKNTGGKTYRMIAGLTAKTFNTDLGTTDADVANGRLTLETGVAVSTTDQTAKTTIYFTPFRGNVIRLYDGSAWNFHTFTERSLALGTLANATNYDVFLYSNAGTLTLELSAAWASATARTDALTLQDGIYVKTGATTRRYLGTLRTTSTTTTEDSLTKRFLWNYYNRVTQALYRFDGTSHSYALSAARMWNDDAANAIAFVSGVAEAAFNVTVLGNVSGAGGVTAVGLDSLSVYRNAYCYNTATASAMAVGTSVDPQIGYHALDLLESAISGAITFNSAYVAAVILG